MAFRHSPTVTVNVSYGGDDGRTFYVHQCLLEENSEHFRRAIASNFREAHDRIFDLDDEDPAAFDLFVQYVYDSDYKVASTLSRASGGCRETWYPMHAAAYALGNFLIAPGFKDLVFKKLATCFERGDDISMELVLDMAKTIYSGTSSQDGNEMRLMIAYYTASRFGREPRGHHCLARSGARIWTADEITELATALPDFVANVMRGLSSSATFKATEVDDAIKLLSA